LCRYIKGFNDEPMVLGPVIIEMLELELVVGPDCLLIALDVISDVHSHDHPLGRRRLTDIGECLPHQSHSRPSCLELTVIL